MKRILRFARWIAPLLIVGIIAYTTNIPLAKAAPAFVQNVTDAGSSPKTTGNFGASVTSGDLLTVGVIANKAVSNDCTSVTDTAGNTYTRAFSITSVNQDLELWYSSGVTGGSSFHFVVTCGSGDTVNVSADEYSGVASSNALDQWGMGASTSTATVLQALGGKTCVANEVVVGVGGDDQTRPFTVGASFSNLHSNTSGAQGIATQSMAIGSTGIASSSMTIDLAEDWTAGFATFSASSCASQKTLFIDAKPGVGNLNWQTPPDWNNSNNQIACIGSGGNGASASTDVNSGGAGGSGAYASTTNLTLSGAISYSIGSTATTTSADNGTGGARETYFNGSASSSASVTCDWGHSGNGATGGIGGTSGQSIGTTKNSGANGGSGASTFSVGGAGGAGAAGMFGVGRSGGTNSITSDGGSGGGGSDGGSSTAGSNAPTNGNGGNGGRNYLGSVAPNGALSNNGSSPGGNGNNGSNGTGAGGAGSYSGATNGIAGGTGGNGSCDKTFDGFHNSSCSGGSGGGGNQVNSNTNAGGPGGNSGQYGGGGAGGGASGTSGASGGAGGIGGQGLIVIIYTPAGGAGPTTSCVYSGAGDWDVKYSDNCIASTTVYIAPGKALHIIRDNNGSFAVTAGAKIISDDGAVLLQSPVSVVLVSGSNGVSLHK